MPLWTRKANIASMTMMAPAITMWPTFDLTGASGRGDGVGLTVVVFLLW